MSDGDRTSEREYALRLGSDLRETGRVRRLISDVAAETGFSPQRAFDMCVAVSEAAANAIEHTEGEGAVRVNVLIRPDRVEVHIQGPGEFHLPSPAEGRQHRGLGLPLMATLSDHLALYSRAEGGTLVALTFYRTGHEAAPSPLPPGHLELIEQKHLLDAVLTSVPVGMYILDEQLRFRWANPFYRALLGQAHRECEITGLGETDILPRGGEALDILRRVSLSGRPFTGEEYQFEGCALFPRFCTWQVQALKTEGGPPYQVIGVISDVTDQVTTREMIRAMAGELEVRAREAERSVGRQLHLQRVAQQVLSEDSVEGLLRQIVEAACAMTDSEIGTAATGLATGGFRVAAVSHGELPPPGPPGREFAIEKGGVYLDIIRGNRSIRFGADELKRQPAWWGLPDGHIPLHGLLGAPLRVRNGKVTGVVMVSRKRSGEYTEEDERLLVQLTALASLGLEHVEARLLAEEQMRLVTSRAAELQNALISIPTAVDHVRFGHAYRSASRAAQVGGDFYDVFPLAGERVGIVVGDVSGSGVEAASLGSLIREIIRAYALHNASPRHILSMANQSLIHRDGFRHFVTVALALLEPATGRVRFSLAGHPPPVLVSPEDAVMTRWRPAPPLGAFDDARYSTGRARLGPEDMLVFYTDGVTEARRGGEFFGERTLVDLLGRLCTTGPENLPERLLAEVDTFADSGLRDDAAVVAVGLGQAPAPPGPQAAASAEA